MYCALSIIALASTAIAAPIDTTTTTPDLSSLLGGSGLSSLTGLLGGSGSSGLSSLLGGSGSGASGLGGLTSLLGGSGGSSGLSSLLGGSGGAGGLGALTSILGSLPIAGGLLSGLGGIGGLKEREIADLESFLDDVIQFEKRQNVGFSTGVDLSGLDIDNLLSGAESDLSSIIGALPITANLGLTTRQDASDSDILDELLSELGGLPVVGNLVSELGLTARQASSDSDIIDQLLSGLDLSGILGNLPVVGSLTTGLTSGLNLRDAADIDTTLNAFGITDLSSDAEISNIFSELPILGELFPQN